MCCEVAGAEVVRAAEGNPFKLLWNLAVNLSVGPPSPVGDPGMGFDADTEPDPDRPDRRRLDRVSAHLKKLDDVYTKARKRRKSVVGDAVWRTMADHLRAAQHAATEADGTLSNPKEEQWIYDEQNKQHQRKALRWFPKVEGGAKIFESERAIASDIRGYLASNRVIAEETVRSKSGLSLTLTFDEATVHHICQRHTYRHFDFSQVKAVNNFWPPGTDFDTVVAAMAATLRDITEICLTELMELSSAESAKPWSGLKVKLGNREAGGHTVFFIASIREAEDKTSSGVIKTIAPDSSSAHAFLGTELAEIAELLGIQPHPPPQPTLEPAPQTPSASAPTTPPDAVMEITTKRRWKSDGKVPANTPVPAPVEVFNAAKKGDLKHGDYVKINGAVYLLAVVRVGQGKQDMIMSTTVTLA
ncbi:hypothetical protein ACIQMJ_08730 [Actinosynnema sp. NPDC091369]